MKKNYYRTRGLQFFLIFISFIPLHAFAKIQLVACFEGKASAEIVDNKTLEPFTKNLKCFLIGSVNYEAQGSQVTFTPGIGVEGQPAFSDVSMSKNVDTNSPGMLLNMLTANKYDTVILTFFDTGFDGSAVIRRLQIELKDAFTTQISVATESGDTVLNREVVSFSFSEITTSVEIIDEKTGEISGGPKTCFSRITNEEC